MSADCLPIQITCHPQRGRDAAGPEGPAYEYGCDDSARMAFRRQVVHDPRASSDLTVPGRQSNNLSSRARPFDGRDERSPPGRLSLSRWGSLRSRAARSVGMTVRSSPSPMSSRPRPDGRVEGPIGQEKLAGHASRVLGGWAVSRSPLLPFSLSAVFRDGIGIGTGIESRLEAPL